MAPCAKSSMLGQISYKLLAPVVSFARRSSTSNQEGTPNKEVTFSWRACSSVRLIFSSQSSKRATSKFGQDRQLAHEGKFLVRMADKSPQEMSELGCPFRCPDSRKDLPSNKRDCGSHRW